MRKFIILLSVLFCNYMYSQDIVTASVYNATPQQCNEDYLHTAFMYKLDSVNHYKEKIIAVSRDLLDKYPNKTKVSIKGTDYDGIYTVRDKMGVSSIHRGVIKNSIDILIDKDMKIGFWTKVEIKIINN